MCKTIDAMYCPVFKNIWSAGSIKPTSSALKWLKLHRGGQSYTQVKHIFQGQECFHEENLKGMKHPKHLYKDL